MAENAEQKVEPKVEPKEEYPDVPYPVHKEMVQMLDANNRRLVYTNVFMVVVIFLIVATGIWFLNQYDVAYETVTVDSTDGVANYIGNDGSIPNVNP